MTPEHSDETPRREGPRGRSAPTLTVPRKPSYSCPRREDFDFGSLLGEGAFARVYHATHICNGDEYAVKTVEKRQIQVKGRKDAIMNEKMMLTKLDHPGIIHLHFAFQDDHALYFVLELCEGGELAKQIERMGVCQLEFTQFYTAEIIAILKYLRVQRVAHRDLKPQNLLLTADGHLKLVDFDAAITVPEHEEGEHKGSAAAGQTEEGKPSFAGTSLYLAPEVLLETARPQGAFALDLWALGCVIFQMLVGTTPFHAETEYLVFQRILARNYEFPAEFPHSVGRELIDALLAAEPDERPGHGREGLLELEKHAFFGGSRAAFSELRRKRPPPRVNRSLPPRENNDSTALERSVPSFNCSSAECTPEIGQNFLARRSQIIHVGDKCPNTGNEASSSFIMTVESESCFLNNKSPRPVCVTPQCKPRRHSFAQRSSPRCVLPWSASMRRASPRCLSPKSDSPKILLPRTPPPRVDIASVTGNNSTLAGSRLEWWTVADVGGKSTRQWINELEQKNMLMCGENLTICGSVILRRFPCFRRRVLAITNLPRLLIFDAKGEKLLYDIDPAQPETLPDNQSQNNSCRSLLKDSGPIQVSARSHAEFQLSTGWRSFRCSDKNIGAEEWVSKIELAVRSQSPHTYVPSKVSPERRHIRHNTQ